MNLSGPPSVVIKVEEGCEEDMAAKANLESAVARPGIETGRKITRVAQQRVLNNSRRFRERVEKYSMYRRKR